MAKASGGKRKELGPWRVDGISAEAIAAATAAAERAGVELAVWLDRLIRDSAERERQTRALHRNGND